MFRFKKYLYIFITLMVLTSVFSRPSYAAVYSVTVNGTAVTWSEINPYMRLGRLMVPLGRFGTAMDAEDQWDAKRREAFIFWRGRYAWLQASNPTLYYGTYTSDAYGGKLLTDVSSIEMSVRPDLMQNRLMVPLALLAEALGGWTDWNAEAKAANVTLPIPVRQINPVPGGTDNGKQRKEQNKTQEQGYFQLISAEEIHHRYQNDSPFVLVQFDNSISPSSLYDVLQAAADLKIKIFGLETTKETAAQQLPFAKHGDGGGSIIMYMINGFNRVEIINEPGYQQSVDALLNYMHTE